MDAGAPVQLVLVTVAAWAAVHLLLGPMNVPDERLLIVLLVGLAGVIAPALVSAVVGRGGPGTPAMPFALALTGALVGVAAGVSGNPLLALDVALVVVVAAMLLPRAQLLWVTVTVAAPWAAGLGHSVAMQWRSGRPGEFGPWSQWALGLGVLVAATGIALAVADLRRRRAEEGSAERERWLRLLQDQSVQDVLTGVVNRTGAGLVAVPMIEHARRSGQAVNCLYLDVDGLREVNEAAGPAGGDAVLRMVAESVRDCVRTTDLLARWTGDEFVVVGPGTGMSPLELERRVRAALMQDPVVSTETWTGRVSVGSATLVPWDEGDLFSLVGKAEKDMQLRRSLRRQAREAAADLDPLADRRTQPRH